MATETMMPEMDFTKLLAEAQAEMKNPPKAKKGQKGNQVYMYATLDSVLEIVRPPLNKRGIFLWQESEPTGNGMLLRTKVAYLDCERTLDVKPYEYRQDPKDFGASESYARRYSLLMAFGLAGEDDNDGTVSAKASKPPAKPEQKAAKPPADNEGRQQWINRLSDLMEECTSNGVKEEGIDSYVRATYGCSDYTTLNDKDLEGFGKHLSQLAADSKAMKEKENVD